jgi:hypothetical protein
MASGDWKAKILNVVGKVQVIRNGVKELAQLDMILSQNDTIESGNGTADLKVVNLGVLKVKPQSTVQLANLTEKTKLNLKKGKVLLALNKLKKDSSFEIETPTAVAGVRGTSFLVSASGDNTKIGVLTGKVEVRSFDGFVAVGELNEVKIAGKELKAVTRMDINTIVDVKSILKIKDVASIEGFSKIKANIKKLEIIESTEKAEGIDVEELKKAIKAKEMSEDNSMITEELQKKSSEIKSSTVDSSKQKLISDEEF